MFTKAISQATIAAIALSVNPALNAAGFSFKPAVHLDGITNGQYNYFMGNQSGDFNGDGLPDLLALVETNIINTAGTMTPEAWLYGTRGGAVLALPSRFPIVNAGSGSAVADFNEDGVDDLVTGASATTSIATLLSNGHGGLVSGPSVTGPTSLSFHDVSAIDVNHDGHADVLAWSGSTGYFDSTRDLYVFSGNGTGHFSPPIALNVYSGGRRQVGNLWQDTILADYTVADVNGDTYPDLILGYEIRTWGSADPDRYEGRIRIQRNNGSGTFTTPLDYPITNNFTAIAAGDFNGDGRTDIATDNFSILQQSSTGGFAETSRIPVSLPTMGMIATDLDGDNRDDAMVLHQGWYEYGYYLQSAGEMIGEWLSPTAWPLHGANYYRKSTAIADFMGTGCKDAAVAMDYSGLDLLEGQECKVSPPHESIIVRDIDADGNGTADLLWRPASGNVFITWYMSGAVRSATHVNGMPDGYRLVAAADFNGDKTTDLLWTSAANDLTMSIGSPSGYSSQAVGINYAAGWSVVGAADMNGDGNADIILRNNSLGLVVVWYMKGSRRVAYTKYNLSSGYQFVGVGDFNRDGRKDTVWTGPQHDVLFEISGATSFTPVLLGLNYLPDYELATVMDVDGNGTSDLVLRSKRLGLVQNWFLAGTSRVGYSSRTIGGSFRLVGKGDFNNDGRGDLVWVNDSNKILISFSTGSSFRNAYLPYPVGVSYKLMDAR